MKKIRNLILIMVVIFIAININLYASSEDDSTYVHGRAVILVSNIFTTINIGTNGYVETEKEWFNQLANQYEIYNLEKVFNSNNEPLCYYYEIEFPENFTVLDVCEDFEAESEVNSTFPDYKVELFAIPNDEYYNYQWVLPKIQAEQAWDVPVNNTEPIIVAIVDTGVDVAHPNTPTVFNSHPDLMDNLYMENNTLVGYNYFFIDRLPYDDIGHGTHVAGIVAATCNNYNPQTQEYEGIASLAGWENYNVKIMPVKVAGRYPNIMSWTSCLNGVE